MRDALSFGVVPVRSAEVWTVGLRLNRRQDEDDEEDGEAGGGLASTLSLP